VEIVTIHSSKGLEWPVVIPINTSTQFPPPPQFIHRRSNDTLHWVLGGVMPPELAAAREEEKREELLEHQRMWYVACTRARDLLVIPHLPKASSQSWSKILDLGLAARTRPHGVACTGSISGGGQSQHAKRRAVCGGSTKNL
jgi:ATP-dependent exoDNAse (exonuclease V) beta subunit